MGHIPAVLLSIVTMEEKAGGLKTACCNSEFKLLAETDLNQIAVDMVIVNAGVL